ncbi:hypothetical protein F2Q68_00043824 [Brassica cretica]|uniref:Uncharacterized protein n=1 Tax=Brassica cretica TaxID=69181 RepID=A0A8S9LGY7_BRACR|nr:hypothetical protein F2Q68_00043824 [Brassica cretica]
MQPDIWEEWWRPTCVLDMQPAMWSIWCRRACVRSHAKRHTGCHQPEADWLLSSIKSPLPQLISSHPDLSLLISSQPLGTVSVQLNSSKAVSIFDGQAEVLSGVSSGPRVQISPSRPVSFFMVKPRFCPSQVKSSPVQSSRPTGFGQVLSDQPAASRLEHCRSPGCDVDTTGPMPYRLDYEYCGFKETPYSLDREDSDERGHVLWLSITRRCNVAVTRRTVGCRAVTRRTVGRGRLKVPSSGLALCLDAAGRVSG